MSDPTGEDLADGVRLRYVPERINDVLMLFDVEYRDANTSVDGTILIGD